MEGQGLESGEDDFQQLYGHLSRRSITNPTAGNTITSAAHEREPESSERGLMASSLDTRSTLYSSDDTPLSRASSSAPVRPPSSPLLSTASSVAFATAPTSSLPRRDRATRSAGAARFADEGFSMLADNTIPQAEKDGDDPSTSTDVESSRPIRDYAPSSLARLLATHSTISPSDSSSYVQGNGNLVRRSLNAGTATLPDHLYTRGLLGGKHSDISVIVFGHRYNLHRLILDRAPFFTTALSEPWLESKAKEIVLHPEEIDASITQRAFELALKRLYGMDICDEEEAEAVGLFATGCWLEMQELVDSAIELILRQMRPETLAQIIKIVAHNYYGRPGEKILASAKAMLCRDGWEMSIKYWDEIPGEIVREIVGGDGFYINGEWERWILTKRLLDRRLKQIAIECDLIQLGSRTKVKAPDTLSLNAVRFDTVYRKNAIITAGKTAQSQHEKWISLYTHPDIEPLLVLLDEGIHYVHLEFERLQYIRLARDVFGLPILPERVISNALWQQMELRQKVVNGRDGDLELGLSQPAEEPHCTLTSTEESTSFAGEGSKSKQKVSEQTIDNTSEEDDELDSGSWDANAQPRKFWIPTTDCNIVMGGNAEPVITTSTTSTFLRLASRMSATLDAGDVLWAADFAASPSSNIEGVNRPTTPLNPTVASAELPEVGAPSARPKPITYSRFPPFRFAAEFPNPRSLKEKKRVYSRTVFYAGSYWNIYIQKVRSAKNPRVQLGVYLHRAKERESEDKGSIEGGIGAAGSVDERIDLLEREMIFRSQDRRGLGHRAGRQSDRGVSHIRGPGDSDDGSMAAFRRRTYGDGGNILDTSYTAFDSEDSDSSDQLPNALTHAPSSLSSAHVHFPLPMTDAENTRRRSLPINVPAPAAKRAPALPPYIDTRPTIKTYFKIYSPSKGGRLLSVYESAPDKFDFSQSWGWKSSTLMLDEGFCTSPNRAESVPVSAPEEEVESGNAVAGAEGGRDGDAGGAGSIERERRRRKEGVLRFMVCIGNL